MDGNLPDLAVFKLHQGFVIHAKDGAMVAVSSAEEMGAQVVHMLTAAHPARPPEMGGACPHPPEARARNDAAGVEWCRQCGGRLPAAEGRVIAEQQSPVAQKNIPANSPPERLWNQDAFQQGLRGQEGAVPSGMAAEYQNLGLLAAKIVSGQIPSDQFWGYAQRVCPNVPGVDVQQALDSAEHEFYEQRRPEHGRLAEGEPLEYQQPIRLATDFGPEDRSLFGREPQKWTNSQQVQGFAHVEEGVQACACPGCAFEAPHGDVCVACHNGRHPHRMVEGKEYTRDDGSVFTFRRGGDDGARTLHPDQTRGPVGPNPVPNGVPPRDGGTLGRARARRPPGGR